MKRIYKILLSVVSGLLLGAGWPEHGFPFLLFLGFIPLLVVEYDFWQNRRNNHSSGFIPYIVLSVTSWVLFTTWWMYVSTPVGILAPAMVNNFLIGGAIYLFHVTHRKLSDTSAAYVALPAFLLTAEYIHLRWDLNFPWLNLGNGFAAYPKLIQWYEYTGVSGGSLWVIAINVLLFFFVRDRLLLKQCNRKAGIYLSTAIILIIIPVIISICMYNAYVEKKNPVNIVVVQPNIDPYKEQYTLDPLVVTERMLAMAAQKTDSLTQFVIFPESAIQEYIFEDQFESSSSIARIRSFNLQYRKLNVITGISSRKLFLPGEPLSSSARKFSDADKYYDSYNTALFIAHDSSLQKYHKSKLTPGVELMPYLHIMPFLKNLALDLGGTVGSLGINSGPIPFRIQDTLQIAPCICYESVFGEYVTGFISNGASLIFVITNDGWWGNTPGHRQHLYFSVLRAIETRRSIARSANTGISCFINQRGDIIQRTNYWEPSVIRGTINANDTQTFYVRYGDYIGRISLLLSGLFILVTVSASFRKKTI